MSGAGPESLLDGFARSQLRRANPQSKSFHSPFGRASHFLLLVQETVTKENTPFGIALFGLLPEKYAASACVPLSAHPCARSGIGAIHRAAASRIAAAAAAMQKG